MNRLLFALLVVLSGCAGYVAQTSQQAAAGAVAGATTGQAATDIDRLAASATAAARDEVLGPATDALLQKIVADVGAEVRRQVAAVLTRELVRALVDEALGRQTLEEVDQLRETMFGQPLQTDVDAVIADAIPRLAQALQTQLQSTITPLRVEADQEAAKWRPVAYGFAAGSALLLVGLVVLLHHHRKVLETMKGLQS